MDETYGNYVEAECSACMTSDDDTDHVTDHGSDDDTDDDANDDTHDATNDDVDVRGRGNRRPFPGTFHPWEE